MILGCYDVKTILKIKMRRNRIIAILCLALLLGSCAKMYKPRADQGSNSIIYERSYSDPAYEISTASMTSSKTFLIGEFNIYQDAVGRVTYSAFGSATDGKPNWIRNVEISNLKLSPSLKLTLYNSGSSSLSNTLTNCQLFYTYYPMDNSGKTKVLLANFIEYNASKDEVIMQPVNDDLTNLFKEQIFGGKLEILFKFAPTPHDVGKLNLRYTIPFDFDYAYSSKEADKKD